MSNPKIIFKTGQSADETKLAPAEIGILTDTGKIVIGTDTRYGSELTNTNNQILTELSGDQYREMHNRIMQDGTDHTYYLAYLEPNTASSVTLYETNLPYGFSVGRTASFSLHYTMVNNNSGALTRSGEMNVYVSNTIDITDSSVREDNSPIDLTFVRNGNDLEFHYSNYSPDHQILRFRVIRPRDDGYVTSLTANINIMASLQGEYHPSPIRDRLIKIGGTNRSGLLSAFGTSENALMVPTAIIQNSDSIILGLRIHDSTPDNLDWPLDGSAPLGENVGIDTGGRCVVCKLDNSGMVIWQKEITNTSSVDHIYQIGNVTRCVVRHPLHTSIVDITSDDAEQVTYNFNETCIGVFDLEDDMIIVMDHSIKRKNNVGADVWSINISNTPHSVKWYTGRLIGTSLYVVGLINDGDEITVLKLNALTGTPIWHREFTPVVGSQFNPVSVIDQVGNITITRFYNSTLYVNRIDSEGNSIWARSLVYQGEPYSYNIGQADQNVIITMPIGDINITILNPSGTVLKTLLYTDMGEIRRTYGLDTNGGLALLYTSSTAIHDRMNYTGVMRLPIDILFHDEHHNHQEAKAYNPREIMVTDASYTQTLSDGYTPKGLIVQVDNFETHDPLTVIVRNDNYPIVPQILVREDRATTQGDYWTGYIRGLQPLGSRDTILSRKVVIRDIIYVVLNCQDFTNGLRYILLYRLTRSGTILTRKRILTTQVANVTGMMVTSVITIMTSNFDKITLTLQGDVISETRKFSNITSWGKMVSFGSSSVMLANQNPTYETLVQIDTSNNILETRLLENDPTRSSIVNAGSDIIAGSYIYAMLETGSDNAPSLVKLSQMHDPLWSRRFTGTNMEINRIATDSQDRVYLLIDMDGPIILCLDQLGNKLWARSLSIQAIPLDLQVVDDRVFVILQTNYELLGNMMGRTFVELVNGQIAWARTLLPYRGDDLTDLSYDVLGNMVIEIATRNDDVMISSFPIGAGTDVDDDGERQWIVPQISSTPHVGIEISTGTIRVETAVTITSGSNVTIGGITDDVRNNISSTPLK